MTAQQLLMLVVAIFGLRLLRVGLLLTLTFAWLRHSHFARSQRVLSGGYSPGQLRSEAGTGLQVLAFDAVAAALIFAGVQSSMDLQHLGQLFDGQGWTRGVLTFAALFVWYELWFYMTHRLLHTRWGWRWHRQHHVAVVCSPLSAFSFSLGERAVLLAGVLIFAAAGAALGGASLAGMAAYGLLNQFLNVLGHSNVEPCPARLAPPLARSWWVTPTFHALHHARRRSHFGLFTTVLDRWCGTVERDYEKALRATSGGRTLLRTHSI
jgi:Delta7-sterol 5-desaturase